MQRAEYTESPVRQASERSSAVAIRHERFGAGWSYGLMAADIAILAAVATGVLLARFGFNDVLAKSHLIGVIGVLIVALVVSFERIGTYRGSSARSLRDELYSIIAAATFVALPVVFAFTLLPGISPSRTTIIVFAVASVLTLIPIHGVAYILRDYARRRKPRNVMIVGTRERVQTVREELMLARRDDVHSLVVHDFDETMQWAVESGRKIDVLPWLNEAVRHRATELIITEAPPPEIVTPLMQFASRAGIKLAFSPVRMRPHGCAYTIEEESGITLIRPSALAISRPGAALLRRTMDLVIVVPALIVIAPVCGLIALAVRLDSAGGVIYRQARVGKDEVPFEMLKFRTMSVDAEGASGPVWNDTKRVHVTRVGRFLRRFSLDELPQLWNVARGQMSLVGPRPERPFFVKRFKREYPRFEERLLVRPGITGWAQINMSRVLNTEDVAQKLENDLFYLQHWSPLLDLSILVKTAAEFLFHRAA